MRSVENYFLLIVDVNELLKTRVGYNNRVYVSLIVLTFFEVVVQVSKVVFHRLSLRFFVENVIVQLLELLKLEAGLLIHLNLLLVFADSLSLAN